MKSKFRFAKPAIVSAIVVCLSGNPLFGADNFWTGTTDSNWNTATNWSLGVVPLLPDDAVVNVKTPNIATITANPTSGPRDFRVGQGAGADGQVNHISGSATTGGGNWAFIGRNGGTGVYNLANTAGTGGTLTGFAKGSGNFTCNGSRLYVGGGNDGPTGGNATFNINTTGTLAIGSDLAIGVSPGAIGIMNVDSGTITTGGWNFIGKNENGAGGVGTLNMSGGMLSNTGRTYIGNPGCTGTLNLSGGTYKNVNNEVFVVGGTAGEDWFGVGGGTAFVTISHPDSLLQAGGEFWVGNRAGGTGTLTISAGTLTTNNWTVIGRDSGNGTVNMSGGTINKNGGGQFIIADWGSTAVMTQSAGAVNVNGQVWVGQGGAANGTYTLSGGTITNNNWVAVGRDTGIGLVTMTGGTWTKTGGGNFIIGASGPGTLNQSGGLVDVQAGETWMGENNVCNYTLSGTGELRANVCYVGRWGGGNSTVNLNGGTLRVSQLLGGDGGTRTANFDGTQIIANGHQPTFIANLLVANVGAGGLKINSNGYNLTVSQALTGVGGVTKSGTGTLVLNGSNTYGGANQINNGKLVLTTAATGTGGITLANGAALGVSQTIPTTSLTSANATFGASAATTLDIDLGNVAGNPTAAPLNVTGALTLNGPVTVNVADLLPATGLIPLVSYVGPKAGSGTFVLGTLPNGVQATLVDDGVGMVALNVTSVALPIWTGLESNAWDIATTANWIDGVTGSASTYLNPAPVLFNDSATDPLVQLGVTVAPSKVTFNNSTLGYTLEGIGKITGPASLIKQGTAALEISIVGNDYTGPTTLEGGITTVSTLANGGSPSSIGASTSAASNLTLSGATLNYTGPSVITNRGLTILGTGATIRTTNDLTISGQIACIAGNFAKTGTGNLILSNPGANVLGTISPGARVDGGSLTLNGSGTQTNTAGGDFYVGSLANVAANLLLNATTLNVGAWLAVGRGNGDTDTVSTVTAIDSTINTGNLSSGYDGGQANNSIQILSLTSSTWANLGATLLSESINSTTSLSLTNSTYTTGNFRAAIGTTSETTISLSGNSTVTSNGASLFGEGTGAKVNLTVGGTSSFISKGEFLTALGTDSVATITIQDSGNITKSGGWFAIGNSNNGVATMTVKNNGTLVSNADFNIGDVGTSKGTLYIMDSATVTSANNAFIGKNTGTSGTVIQTGGTFNGNEWIPIGRYNGSIGNYEISGGTLNQNGPGNGIIVGEEGTGTLTVSATGAVVSLGRILISNNATGVGTLNLNGGTITAKEITEGAGAAGLGTFNFNGGTLIAGTGANANFMNQLDTVNVQTGGAIIDTNGQNVAINQSLGYAVDSSGGLTKLGAGTLFLNGVHSYTGPTRVNAGTLAGNGSFAGPITVANGANLNPGETAGLMIGTAVTFETGSTFTVDMAATPDTLQAGQLNISGATLAINGTPTLPVYVIAQYAMLTGTFAGVPTLPAGYTLDYAYNGGTEIALVRPLTAYQTWATARISDIDPFADATPGGDPDGDKVTNNTEFALDGNPLSAVADGKVVGKVANVGGQPTLVLSLPVRTGASFTGTTEQVSALIDGLIYKIQGSDELTTWTLAVSEVLGGDKLAIEASLPVLSGSGWTYRTFRSPGGVAGDPQDFLRAVIVTP